MESNNLLNDIQELLETITTSRKGNIGSIDNIYFCQLDSEWCDSLLIKVQRHLSSAMHPDGEGRCVCPAGVGICGFGDPDTNICNHPRR